MESAGHLEECENPKPIPCYRASSAVHHVRSFSIIYVLPDRADVPTEEQTLAPYCHEPRLDNDRADMLAIHRPADRPRPMFDLLSPPDASTVLLRTDKNRTAYEPTTTANMPAVTMPTDHLTRQYLPEFFFPPTFVLLRPDRPRGGPRRGGVTRRLGASLFKRRGRELGDNGVLGGTIKNGRLLVICITSPGWAMAAELQDCHMYQPNVRAGAVRPKIFFYRPLAALPAANPNSTTCCSACS